MTAIEHIEGGRACGGSWPYLIVYMIGSRAMSQAIAIEQCGKVFGNPVRGQVFSRYAVLAELCSMQPGRRLTIRLLGAVCLLAAHIQRGGV
jgi:hypothetical protein